MPSRRRDSGGGCVVRPGVCGPRWRVRPRPRSQRGASKGGVRRPGRIDVGASARPADERGLADLGRLLFFDTIVGLHDDNTCAGCHSPPTASATRSRSRSASRTTTSSGPAATGPRNQRRTPIGRQHRLLSEADVERPLLRAVGRSVRQLAGLPLSRCRRARRSFPPDDPVVTHLLDRAGAHPADRAGRGGRLHRHAGTIGPRFDQFDDGLGGTVPPPDARAASATSRSARRCSRA